MDIWIRSQDKQELIKIDYIEANMGRIFIQYGTFRKCVGTYATKERALEILQEIQIFMANNIQIDCGYQEADIRVKAIIASNMHKVYELPKE